MGGNCYLAGAITGLTYDGGNEWRELAKKELAAVGITALSPMRAKAYLRDYGILDDRVDGEPEYFEKHVTSSPRGIMTRDRWDATRCDVLFVNLLGADRVSIGTIMEIAWADLSRIPIVVAMEDHGNVHDHPMVTEATGFRVPTFEEGLRVVKALLLP